MTNEESTTTILNKIRPLPQPKCIGNSYKYCHYDEFSSSLQSQIPTLPPNYPCRLLLSKGKNKAAQLSPHTVSLVVEDKDQKDRIDENEGIDNHTNTCPPLENQRRTVRYPKGSTYGVKTKYILPITQEKKLIIVAPETKYYRKLCIVQTPNDHSFIEIGCDFALTIGNVECTNRIGIDKSPTSLEIAHQNFPDLPLEEIDILEESEESLMNLLERYEINDRDKLIVGIDINGNRGLEAVMDCLQRVIDLWEPRLVIVKARSLFLAMQGKEYDERAVLK